MDQRLASKRKGKKSCPPKAKMDRKPGINNCKGGEKRENLFWQLSRPPQTGKIVQTKNDWE